MKYEARDRSLLLPYYKRWLVEPLVARLPATLSPNAITHLGHLLNFAALAILLVTGATSGAPLFAAALLVQLYIVCDNADGTHARRTRQTSSYGEMLDHGLDILNVAYIACIGAIALGLDPTWRMLLVALVTGASAITFFEQSATGLFVLGRLNQQESGALLSVVLCISAVLGSGWWASASIASLSAQTIMIAIVSLTIVVGAMGAMNRVRRARGCPALWPASTMLVWNGAALGLALAGTVSARVALALVLLGNTFFAGRMLARRICRGATPERLAGPIPKMERTLIAAFVAMGVIVLAVTQGRAPAHIAPHLDTALAVFTGALFCIAVIRDARRGLQRVRERPPRAGRATSR